MYEESVIAICSIYEIRQLSDKYEVTGFVCKGSFTL